MAVHYTNLQFFQGAMAKHDCVADCTQLEIEGEAVYRIDRTEGRRSLNVFYSDAYEFGPAEYLGRPKIIKKGDFVLVTPSAGFGGGVHDLAQRDGVILGHFRDLMAALNWSDVWKYKPKPKKGFHA
jgi:hypothetical protein